VSKPASYRRTEAKENFVKIKYRRKNATKILKNHAIITNFADSILKLGQKMLFYYTLGKHPLRWPVKYIILSEKILIISRFLFVSTHFLHEQALGMRGIVLKEMTVVEVRYL